jgi:hypothetical protein
MDKLLCPCIHLDFDEGNYPSCELRNLGPELPGIKFWYRDKNIAGEGAPLSVQFCKLRGRINSILECYENGCLDYVRGEEIDV